MLGRERMEKFPAGAGTAMELHKECVLGSGMSMFHGTHDRP